ncbi:MAG TPA: DinB family protein [Longimicrobiales bacterium]
MTRLDEVRELYRFHSWATERLFSTTGTLTDDELTRDMSSSFPSVRDTLVHMVGSEWVWLTRWHGISPTSFPDAEHLTTHSGISERWRDINAQRERYLNSLDAATLDRTIAYTNFAGAHFEFPLWQMLRHVVNHASYHRGQVVTMLRQLGYKPPATDMILMYQELQSAPTSA